MSAAKASQVKAIAAKVSEVEASEVKAIATKVSEVEASEVKTIAAKVSEVEASAAKMSATKVSAAKASEAGVSPRHKERGVSAYVQPMRETSPAQLKPNTHLKETCLTLFPQFLLWSPGGRQVAHAHSVTFSHSYGNFPSHPNGISVVFANCYSTIDNLNRAGGA